MKQDTKLNLFVLGLFVIPVLLFGIAALVDYAFHGKCVQYGQEQYVGGSNTGNRVVQIRTCLNRQR